MRFEAEVVVLSDDAVLRSLVRDLLGREGLTVAEAGDEAGLREMLGQRTAPLLVVDGILAGPAIGALLGRLPILRHGRVPCPVLLLSGSGASPELRRHPSVTDTLVAPFASGDLVQAVHAMLPGRRDRSETRLRAETPVPDDGTG